MSDGPVAALPFGPYEVLARLATGGAANIFLARQSQGGVDSLVCLKTLLPERAKDQEFVAMFLDEARLAARLNHPNCVAIYDLGREAGTYYITMEYILGETLWGLLATVAEVRAALPPNVVASIMAATAEGLHHAHQLNDPEGRPYNLVHRDVSPQNIMVGYDGRTKVVDFGIAKAETGREATATGIVKGKFSYMSPEQITGGAIDRRSDVYSLGIVMFECLASRRLYRAEAPEDIARMMLEKRPPRLREVVPDIDPALEAIVNKALSRHPALRFQTARDFADALRDHLHAQRFPEGVEPVAALIRERFGARVEERRWVLQRALEGRIDESELLATLNARPVMELDVYATPREETETVPELRQETPEPGDRESPAKSGSVELFVGDDSAEQVRLKESARLSSDVDPEGATRVEGDDLDDQDSTQANPRRKTPSELPVAHPRRRSAVAPLSSLRIEPTPEPRGVVRRSPLPPVRELSISPPEEFEMPHINAPPEPMGALLHESMALALPIAVTGLGAAVEQTPAPSGLATAPMMKVVEAAPSPAIPPYSAPQVTSKPPPGAPALQAYSLGVVLAAMAFGVTLGLLLGVLLTLYR